MTPSQIRAASAAGNSDWEVLQMVIEAGREFPDAVFAVSQALRMDDEQRQAMERDYDECA
jgi:hypothetical protein